jgi:hypothetical protein
MTDENKNEDNNTVLNNEIKNKENNYNFKEEFLSYINSIKNLLDKNISQNERVLVKRINILLIKMSCLFELILKENELILKYESMLRKDENIIRKLYNNIFFLKSTIDYQENTILNFVSKEKEFEKLKEKIGVFYSNGKLIYNGRKDNEIMILRTENSNLKSFIENKEKDIQNKDNEINQLKEKLLLLNKNKKINEKKRIKNKNNSLPNINDLKYSYSNININFNEITHADFLKNYHHVFKNDNKSSNGINNKTIYIPPQLRNDLSLKEIFTKRNINNLYHHKKLKNKKNNINTNKMNFLTNAEKYISVNKSNYNFLTNKKTDRLLSNTINRDSNLGTYSEFSSPPNEINSTKKVFNLKSYIEKDITRKRTEKIVNNIINKLQITNQDKKVPFYSHFASPICKYTKNNLKKNKLILK